MRRPFFLILAVCALVACQTSTDVDEIAPRATGSWSGFGTSGFIIFELFLAISEDDVGRITGAARLTSPGRQTFDFLIREGAHGHPDLLLSMAREDFVDVNFSGTFMEADSIDGRINGSGFDNAPVTIVRHALEPALPSRPTLEQNP